MGLLSIFKSYDDINKRNTLIQANDRCVGRMTQPREIARLELNTRILQTANKLDAILSNIAPVRERVEETKRNLISLLSNLYYYEQQYNTIDDTQYYGG